MYYNSDHLVFHISQKFIWETKLNLDHWNNLAFFAVKKEYTSNLSRYFFAKSEENIVSIFFSHPKSPF